MDFLYYFYKISIFVFIMEINNTIVKELGKQSGADVTGIASAISFEKAAPGFGSIDKLKSCRSVIVVGCPFPEESIFKPTPEYTDIRNHTVKKVNEIAAIMAKSIRKMGYDTKVIGGLGGKWDDGRFRGHISLKHAAELAGLGKITRNYLLTHPEYGNMLWFAAVLTSASIEPDQRVEYDICNGCNRCVEICPSGALNDPNIFGQKECYRTCYKTVKGKLDLKCFECRKVCPHRFGIDVKEIKWIL